MKTVRLENWIVFVSDAPRLHGEAYGHPQFKDGEKVYTSPIVRQYKNGRVRTKNTNYILGKPAEVSAG